PLRERRKAAGGRSRRRPNRAPSRPRRQEPDRKARVRGSREGGPSRARVGGDKMTPAPVKPAVPLAALEALDIRVGTIQTVEDIPRSDKLMRLVVCFGDH